MRIAKVERRSAIMTYGDNLENKAKVGLIAIGKNGYTSDDYFFDYDEGEPTPIKRNSDDGFDPLGYGDKPWFILPKNLVEMVIEFGGDVDNNEPKSQFEKVYSDYLDNNFRPEDRADAKVLCDRQISLIGQSEFFNKYINK